MKNHASGKNFRLFDGVVGAVGWGEFFAGALGLAARVSGCPQASAASNGFFAYEKTPQGGVFTVGEKPGVSLEQINIENVHLL